MLLLALAIGVVACGRPAPVVAPSAPAFPEFPFPSVSPDIARAFGRSVAPHEAAWQYLQAGDLGRAERGFADVVRRSPGFFPSVAALGYVELARGEPARALGQFDRALVASPRYVPALLGRGEALLATGQQADAILAFDEALDVDPTLTNVRQRLEVLRFRVARESLTTARMAAAAGRLDEARAAFRLAIAGSPESGFLHRELAEVDLALGDTDAALAGAERAFALDSADLSAALLVARVHEAAGRDDQALAAFEQARRLGAGGDVDARIDAIRERMRFSALPDAARAIPGLERISRADLAALIGIRLEPLLQIAPRRAPVLLTDTRTHWAQAWIASVAQAGVIEAFPNHTFLPRASVRRSDLAQATSRLLALIARQSPATARSWIDDRRTFADLGPGHLLLPAASSAVASGVMAPVEGNRFAPSRYVSGAEASEVVERLEALAARAGIRRR